MSRNTGAIACRSAGLGHRCRGGSRLSDTHVVDGSTASSCFGRMFSMRPEAETIEAWAFDYVLSDRLEIKLAPPPRPSRFESRTISRRLAVPGRPPALRQQARRAKKLR